MKKSYAIHRMLAEKESVLKPVVDEDSSLEIPKSVSNGVPVSDTSMLSFIFSQRNVGSIEEIITNSAHRLEVRVYYAIGMKVR